jgi:hypothetical protein
VRDDPLDVPPAPHLCSRSRLYHVRNFDLKRPNHLIGEPVKAAGLGESRISGRRSLTVGLDRCIDRIGGECRRDCRGKPGNAAGADN